MNSNKFTKRKISFVVGDEIGRKIIRLRAELNEGRRNGVDHPLSDDEFRLLRNLERSRVRRLMDRRRAFETTHTSSFGTGPR